MFLPTDRSVQFPNRYQLAPVAGTDNIADLTPAPGEVSDPGTLWNRQAARQMQADLRTLPIAPGYSVSAGDVVDVSGGQVVKTVEAVANVENVFAQASSLATCVAKATEDYSLALSFTSNTMYRAHIRNSDGNVVYKTSNPLSNQVNYAKLVQLSEGKLIQSQVRNGELFVRMWFVTGETSSDFLGGIPVSDTTTSYNDIVVLSETLFISVYNRSGLKAKVGTVTGTAISVLDTEYPLTDNTGANSLSATLLPDDSSGNHRVCVCFSDSGDGNKGKAVIATIDSANQVTWGSVVTFEEANTQYVSCCTTSDVVIVHWRASSSGYAKVLSVSGNAITGQGTSINRGTGMYAEIAPVESGAVMLWDATNNSSAAMLQLSGTALSVGGSFSFNTSGESTYISVAPISSSKFIVAYSDNGNSTYGTTTILEVMGNQIAGSFTDESSTAIALQPGTAGQSIECIFSGTTNASFVSEGQIIDSPGVYGVGVLDGILRVKPAAFSSITGHYQIGGTGGNNRRFHQLKELRYPEPRSHLEAARPCCSKYLR